MSLDAYQGDDAILRMHAERTRKLNGVTLGPDSPLRSKQAGGRPAKPDSQAATRATRKIQLDNHKLEHDEQVELFKWIDKNAATMPDLAKVFAIPNGGKRSPRTSGMLKAEGVKPGIPDVFLLVPRGGYHGLMIEMKRPSGSLSPMQVDWQHSFAKDGYCVRLATAWEIARDHLLEYLELPRT